jgi:hypothetical protein
MLGGSARMQRIRIGEIGITAEQAVDHRRDKAPLQQAAGPRLLQRQGGEQGQTDAAVGRSTRIQRVDDMVGLAEPERQSDHEMGPDVADDIFGDRFWVGEFFRHTISVRSGARRMSGVWGIARQR